MQRTRECLNRLIISNVQYKPFTRSRRALYRSLPNPPGLPPDVPVSDAPVSSKGCSPIIERLCAYDRSGSFRQCLSSMLHLERPLVFFDLEATGTDPHEARIIQVGLQRFVPAREGAALDDTQSVLVDPECEVPASVVDLTGLSPAAIRAAPRARGGEPTRRVARFSPPTAVSGFVPSTRGRGARFPEEGPEINAVLAMPRASASAVHPGRPGRPLPVRR